MDTSVTTPQAVATVIAVDGQAFARDPAGQMRPLQAGDVLLEGDTVVTLPGGQVQLAFVDGQLLTLLPDESFQFSAETSPTTRPEVAEAALPAGEADRIIQALERGENIDDLLESTAAGLDGGNGGVGNDFVRLLRIVEGVDPLSYQFESNTASVDLPLFESGGLPGQALETTDVPAIVGTVILNAPASVVEGGAIVYSATVDVAPQGSPLVLTLSNGLTLTIAVGAFSGTSAPVPVRADDVLAQGDTPQTVSVVGASGGDYSSLNLGSPATSTVSDDMDVTTVSLSADATVAEGGTIVYTASLNNPADAAVTVTLSNGATITIAAGASTGSVSVAAPTDDVYVDAGAVSTTISSASGGNFESLAINPAAATTTISDTLDVTTVSLTTTPSVAEGGSIVYTASLNQVAQTPVSVTLSNGTVITIAAGTASGSVPVAAPADDVYLDAGNVSATIASASGGNFENLAINPAPATTAISDTPDTTTVTLTASGSVAEGGSIVYTASLNNPADSAVTVNLSNGAVINIAAGTSAGSVSVAAPSDDVYVDAGSISATIASAAGGNFENLAINSAAATTSITDTTDATTVSLTASPSVAEGGNITYTASLNNVAQTPVNVTLSNGATISIATGASSGTVSVAAPSDDGYVDAGSVSATIAAAAGGNFENLAINSAAATTSITDTLDATTVSLTATPSVAEGGSIVYVASLSQAAQTPVTVTLSNGATLTIAAGASSNTVSVLAPTDDVYLDAGSVSATLASATGGNFESLAIDPAAATTSISDTLDTTTVSLTATPSVAEGGSITYTASLTSVAQSAVSVTLSNGSTITIAVGASSGSVSIAAPGDDMYLDAGNVSATIASASGGNFENLAIDPAAATTAITDTTSSTTVSLTATPTVAEGGTVTYTASLTSAAQTPVTVTLSNGATITIAAGTASASVNVAAPSDDVYVDAGSISATIASATGGNFESLAINPATATTHITDTLDTTTLSLTATPSVAEGGSIVYTASLTSAAGTAMNVNLANGATISIAAGASTGSVSVAAPTDDVYVDAGSISTTITGTSGGNFESLLVSNTPAVTTVTDTLDTATVSLTGDGSIAEGASGSYTVSLTHPAQTDVTVTLSYSGTATSGTDYSGTTSVTIPAGSSSASFMISALNDAAVEGTENFTVSLVSASGGNFENLQLAGGAAGSVTTSLIDDDVANVSLSATPSLTEAGGNIVYTATLTQAPVSAMTVTLSNGATITIAAGSLSGSTSVPLAAADDVYVDPSAVSATISSISGGGILASFDPSPAVTSITDTLDSTSLSLSATPTVAEGGSIVYTASLTAAAQSAVTVMLSNGSTITIAAGASTGSVSVAAPSDDVYLDAGSISTTITSASGGNFENLQVNPAAATTSITDTLDTTTVSLTATPSLAEGGSVIYTASLDNPAGTPVTVTLSNGAVISIATGASSGSVSMLAPGDDVYLDAGSVSATIASAAGGNFESLSVNPAPATTHITDTLDTTTLSLTSSPSVAEGGSIVYTASLTSAAGTTMTVNLANGATITIAAGSSAGSVSVAAPSDDVYVDAGSISTTITGTSGGNFENLVVDPAAATTVITDTLDTTMVSLSADTSVAEGGNIVYTASLNNPADTFVTVTLSNGAVINIAAGASSGSVSIAAPSDDVYLDAGVVSMTIASASGGNFENLAVNPAAATTTITDTLDTTTVSLTASASVAEGGNITYTASLNHPAGTAITVSLSNGTTIAIAAGSSSGSVSVPAPSDDVHIDAGLVSATITSAAGGNFENLAVNPAAATTTITDTLDTTTVSLTASASVAEGGNISYTANLDNVAQTPVTLTLSNGATIIIAAGASTGTVSVSAPADDVYLDAGNISASISSATGGNFESLAINPAPAVTSIADTTDVTTVSLTATPSVAEGGSIVYTASLNNVAQSAVSVTLSNGATISIAAGASSGTTSVAAPNDDVYLDAGSVSATIAAATGGNFESLAVNPDAATTAIADTLDTTTVSLTASPSVAEGGSIVYTASLNNIAQSPVTVALSNGASITIAAGASSGAVSVAAPSDDVYIDAGSVNATIASATGGNFEFLAIDPAAATTHITDTLDTTTVSLTATASVAEGGSIIYTASLTSAAQSPVSVTLSNGSVVTIAAGASSGSISVAAPSDDVYLDASSVSVSIDSAMGGNFESLAVDPTAASTSITDTADTSTVSLTASPSVAEGGSIIYTASLTNPADTAMTVTLSNGAMISIAAGASSGSVSIAAPSDDVYLDAGSVSATIASTAGGNFESLAISPVAATTAITDTIDVTTVSLTATASVAEGGNIIYTASLNNPAGAAVMVTLSNGGVINIAAGDSSGTVSVAAPSDDGYLDAGSVSATIASAVGGNFENLAINPVAATTTITDTLDTTTVSLTATSSVAEGGSIVYTASLTSAAGTAMTVNLANGATITIAAGSSTGTVSVAAPTDDVYIDAGSISTTITGTSGGNFENVLVSNTPAVTTVTDTLDTTTVSLTATPSVAEGGSIVYTASLNSPAGTAVTVTLSNGAVISIAAGTSSGTVSVLAPSDDVYVDATDVSATIASATGGNFEDLQLNPAAAITSVTDTLDATTLSLTATPSVAEGGSLIYTASLTALAQSTVTVTLSNGSVISIVAGSSTGSVSVAAPTDDVYLDAGNISTTIASATGGNFENLQLNPAAAITSVTDTLDATTLSLTATPSVAEGGSLIYTTSLTALAQSTVTVTLSNGAVISIAAGASSGSISVNAPADDAYLDAGSVSATIASASGGNFESLVVNPAAATTTITDTLDVTTVSLTATPSVAEGGNVVYTASLTAPAQGEVTVTLSNGSVISIAAGASSGSVSVPAPSDDVYIDAGSVSATIAATSGGNFESLVIDPTAATTAITDTLDTTTVSLTASPSIAEGGNIVYTASLNNPAGTAATVTLSNGATISIAAGASSGSVSVPAPTDDVYLDAGSVSATISSASGGNFESLAINPAPATTSITDTLETTTLSISGDGSVAEGASASYTVSLTSPAQSAVTVNLSYSGTAANGADFSGVASVTIPAGAASASFSLATIDDALAEGAESITVGIASATGGNFETLAVSGANGSVSTSLVDNDATSVSLSATPSLSEAGGTIVYTASASQAPASDLTLTLSNGASITLLAGQTTGSTSVAVAPSEDVYLDPDSVSASISTATGGGVVVVIDPTPAITAVTDTLDVTTLSLTATPNVAEGGSIVYTASLNNTAQTPVTLTLSNGATITIAAGASSGTVSVAAPGDDVYVDAGNVSATIASATGGNFENLAINPAPATTRITDTLDTTTVSLTATPSVAEGGNITYTASLDNAAGTPVSVTLSNGAILTIAAGASTGTVSVAAPSDDVYLDAGSVDTTITSATGGNFESLAINPAPAATSITDTLDTVTVSLSADATAAEGGNLTYTASLNQLAQTPVSVTLSNGATLTIAAGASTGTVSVAAPSDDVYLDAGSVSATITSAAGGNFENLAINPAAATTTITDTPDTTTVSLSASASVAEGGNLTFTASLNNVAQTPVSVTLSNGATITIAAGASTGSISVAAPSDDVHVDAGSISTTIASASGGNFENLAINPAPAVTSMTDTIDVTTLLLTASASVAEGGSIVYTANLNNLAGTPVTVTLSNGAVITIAAGASSNSVSVPAPADDAYVDAGILSATIATAAGGNFESLVINPVAAITSITDTLDTTTLDLTASASVVEGGTVTYTASVSQPVTGSPLLVSLSNGLSIAIPVGSSSASVSMAAPDDVYTGGASLAVTVTGTSGANYENLGIGTGAAGSPVVTVVIDDTDPTTVSLSASGSVAEGGNIVYTASLSSAAQAPVSITLSNGAVISIAAGASTGSVSVAAPSDDVYLDAGSVDATITSATGGNFENLAVNPAAAVTSITDTLDTTTVSLTADASVAEGGNLTYTASLNSPAGAAVTISLSNGAVINIAAGASSGSVSVPAPSDDSYIDAGSVSATIASAAGGNFENLAINPVAATTTITDTLDTTSVTLTASASVAEGGNLTYTASLNQVAQTPVNVTLSNGATITIAAGASSGTVSVAAPSDDVYVDAGNVSTTISAATGGNFESLAINPAPAITSITDTLDTTTVSLSADASVAEGGNITYTASLNHVAQTPVSVTLSNGATITIAAGASTGTVSVAAPSDDVYVDAGSVSATIASAAGGNFENLAVNPAAAVTSITDTLDTTTVSLTADASVAEGGNITYTASLNNVAQTPVNVTLSNGATITIAAGASTGTVSIAAPADDVYVDAASVSASITTASGGNFESLVINPVAATTTIIDTLDATTVSLSADASVAEGGNILYTATLSSAAQTPVSITLTNGAVIGIAAGASTGSISVAAPSDDVYLDAGSVSAAIATATGGNFESLAINPAAATTHITDTLDLTTVSLTATPSVAEGGNIVYTASLNSLAGSPVAVTLSNGATITIAAGASTGTVSVAAPSDDVYVDAGSVSATITSASGGNFENLAVNPDPATTSISDTLDTTTLSISGDGSVAEGASASYTVSLTHPAQSAVTVNLSYSGTATNGTDFSGVVSVTIPAGASSASFSIATIDDALVETAESWVVSIASATGGNFESLAVSGTNSSVSTSISDNDTTTLSVSSPTVSEDAGYAQFTVSLSNASSQTTTVSLALTNGSATGADFGPGLEVSTDGGATWLAATSATFPANQTSVLVRTPIANDALDEASETFSLTATHLSGTPITNPGGTATGTATITDDDATPILSIDSVTLNEGAGTATFTVNLNAASGQTVTVNYGTSNGTALSGTGNDYTATSGTLTFNPGTTSQTITVPVLNDAVYEGSEAFNVILSGATNATIGTATGVGTLLDNGTGAGGTDNDMPTLSVSSPTVAETGGYAQFTVSLSNPSTSPVAFTPSLNSGTATLGTDTTAASALEVSTDNGATWSSVSGNVSIAAGSTSVLLRLAVTDDTIVEGAENFTLNATVVGGGTVNGSASGTATITDNDAIVVAGTSSDDDDVNENRDAIASNNIVHTGAISNVAPTVTLAISDSGASGLTSNGEAMNYSWDSASRTLTAGSASGTVFTVTLSATNDGYTFTQLRGIDHAVLAGETQSLNIPLTLMALDANGAPFTSSVFNVTVYDDAPSVTGSRIIATENDGSFSDSGYLTGATVSNDITGVSWNTSALPALVFEGKPVLYVDHGNGTLTGELTDGTLIFRATINPNVVDASNHPQYSFELLNTLGRLGIEAAENSYTVISGGNISNLDLGFGGYLVDSMVAVDGSGDPITINTNNNWIGLGGNWFNPGEALFMSFTDVSGNAGQVRGMDLLVEGQGSAPYTLNWSVTAAIDYSGNTITYSGSVSGEGNADVPFSIPLSGGALYFTDIQVSAPAGSGEFRIALSGIATNDYFSDIPLALDYTLTDADGDTASGLIDVTLMSGNAAPFIGTSAASATVSEEGLINGLMDAVGTPTDATNATVMTGSMAISDPDGTTPTVTLDWSGAAPALTSGGVAVTWTGAGTHTMTGSAGGAEVVRIAITSDGSYTVTLSKAIDHVTANVEDVFAFDVQVSATDGVATTTGTLTVNIEDDSATVGNLTQAVMVPQQDTNLMIILDVSGSMDDASGIVGQTRLQAAKNAINQLIDSYDSLGDVKVRVVSFSTGASWSGSMWADAATGKTQINALVTDLWTNYDAALADAMTAFGHSGKIVGAQNVSYFLSDGAPTYSNNNINTLSDTNGTRNNNSDEGIQAAEEILWTNFLNSNDIKSYALGIGTGLTPDAQTDLNPIAYDGTGAGINTNATLVTNMSQLSSVLQGTVPPATAGNLLSGNVAFGSGSGADGGYMPALTLDGSTYTYDSGTGAITVSGSGGSGYTYDATTHELSLSTTKGGIFKVDMDDGHYTYTPSGTMSGTVTETIGFSLTDADGDTSTGLLTLNVSREGSTITGTSGANTLNGTSGADILIGGGGNDTLSGLVGGDTFTWSLADRGTPASPARDTVTDFDLAINSDKLDLRDLLQGELHAGTDVGNLADYLHFSYDSTTSTTVLEVKSQGAAMTAPDQIINLSSVDLVAGFTSDQQIIQDLLSKGKLITD